MKRDGWALTFAMLFPAVMAWVYFVAVADEGSDGNPVLMTAFGAGKLLQFGFPVLYVWWFERERLRPAWPSTRGLWLGLAFGLGVSLAIFAIYFGWLRGVLSDSTTPQRIFDKVREFGLATPVGFVVLAALISIIHSFFEEYYWRWFVFGWMRRHMRWTAAAIVSGLGFMLHHVIVLNVYFPGRFWTMTAPFSLCIAVGGSAWAWIYHRSESLYATWLSHLVVDVAIMIVGYDLISRYW